MPNQPRIPMNRMMLVLTARMTSTRCRVFGFRKVVVTHHAKAGTGFECHMRLSEKPFVYEV